MKDKNNLLSHFLIIWAGQLLSSIGSGLTAFTLGIYVFQLTGSATNYSLILLASFLPSLLLMPIGGTLSDRVNRKTLMIIGDFGSMIGLLFIIAMLFIGITNLWVIYLGTAVSSIFVAVQNPAYKASITDLVDKKFYAKASGLLQLAESSRYLISPIIAGFLLQRINIKSILMLDVLTFLMAIAAVFWIKTKTFEESKTNLYKHFYQDFIEGFCYLGKNKGVVWLISIISLVTFFIGLLQALLGPMILSFSDAQIFGTSLTIATTGMLIGSCFIGVFGKATKRIPVLSISLVLCGLFFSLIGISENIRVITLFCFLFFLTLPCVNTSLDVLVRNNVINTMQGRIWSLISLISQLGMVIAFGVAGYLADELFTPLLLPGGVLATSIGTIIGVGKGRGIGLMFILSGLLVAVIALVIGQLKTLKSLEHA